MTIGLPLYQFLTRLLSLFRGRMLQRRVRQKKENPERLFERSARNLPARPPGRILWLHGASVGESLLLLELGKQLQTEAPDIHLLFTSQTMTSAAMVSKNLPARALHQMAPIDTPGAAKRFLKHWQPALGIIAEGDVWPNLICRAKKSGARLALVNARMTEKSLKGWNRWRRTAQKVFGCFDVILAADERTANGLNTLLGPVATVSGNLKSALPPPPVNEKEYVRMQAGLVSDRACLLAASTHTGEEALILKACQKLQTKPVLIIAPRHPERGNDLEDILQQSGLSVSRRSRADPISTDTDVLLADTLGEMGLWYRLADAIYLGGGHSEGVGGHNPLEPLKLGKTVISGPDVFNFSDMMQTLKSIGAVRFAQDANDLASLIGTPAALDEAALSAWLTTADAPMQRTLEALIPLLERRP